MAVASVSSAGATTVQQAKAAQTTVDYNSFLRLMVAQAKNQDPTNPTDSTEYLSQLASFSAVEQSIQMNQKLERILSASGLSDANALIGAYVSTEGGAAGQVVGATIRDLNPNLILADGTIVPFSNGLTITRA